MKKISVVLALGALLTFGTSFAVIAENLAQGPTVIYKPTYRFNIPANAVLSSDTVQVSFSLDQEGKITSVSIIEGSGNAVVDKQVQDYFYSWQLSPALGPNGKPIASTVETMIRLDIPDTAIVLPKDAPRQPGESFSDYVKRTSK